MYNTALLAGHEQPAFETEMAQNDECGADAVVADITGGISTPTNFYR
jgi:hypothetical protein